MKKVLIISPHFPPVNAPDMQRVRLSLPHFRKFGWEPVVLAVEPDSVEGCVRDPLLEQTYPADIRVVRIRGITPRLTRPFGFGSLWLRCGGDLARAGAELLAAERFDLVFFSTTQFNAFALGPVWKQRFGVPYVLDYQDPWLNDYYARTGIRPPGGRIKFAFSQWQARRIEPRVLADASAIIAVSDAYGPMLARQHPGFDARRVRLLPFGASASDLEALTGYRPAKPLVDFSDGLVHLVYTGRCGPDMSLAMTVLFRAFRRYLETEPETAGRLRFHFIGTDYAPPPLGREWAVPVARNEGVGRYIVEHCYRVPYFDALYYLRNAQALIAVGSNDPTYSASKIFPYILTGNPLLLIYHQMSPILAFSRQIGAGTRFSFQGPEDIESLADIVHRDWFANGAYLRPVPYDIGAFHPFTAAHLTGEIARIFDSCLPQ